MSETTGLEKAAILMLALGQEEACGASTPAGKRLVEASRPWQEEQMPILDRSASGTRSGGT